MFKSAILYFFSVLRWERGVYRSSLHIWSQLTVLVVAGSEQTASLPQWMEGPLLSSMASQKARISHIVVGFQQGKNGSFKASVSFMTSFLFHFFGEGQS
jgi:hypothetical protein